VRTGFLMLPEMLEVGPPPDKRTELPPGLVMLMISGELRLNLY
jgi:hypothetical protein